KVIPPAPRKRRSRVISVRVKTIWYPISRNHHQSVSSTTSPGKNRTNAAKAAIPRMSASRRPAKDTPSVWRRRMENRSGGRERPRGVSYSGLAELGCQPGSVRLAHQVFPAGCFYWCLHDYCGGLSTTGDVTQWIRGSLTHMTPFEKRRVPGHGSSVF